MRGIAGQGERREQIRHEDDPAASGPQERGGFAGEQKGRPGVDVHRVVPDRFVRLFERQARLIDHDGGVADPLDGFNH